MQETKKKRPFYIDRDKRKARRNELRRVERTYGQTDKEGNKVENKRFIEKSVERAESLQIVQEMARAFASTMEFYKSDWGGIKVHDEAIEKVLSFNESRREYVEGLQPEKVDWSHLAAVAEIDVNDSLNLWVRILCRKVESGFVHVGNIHRPRIFRIGKRLLQFHKIGKVVFVQRICFAQVSAQIKLIKPDFACRRAFFKYQHDGFHARAGERAARQIENRVQFAVFEQQLPQRNRSVIRIR